MSKPWHFNQVLLKIIFFVKKLVFYKKNRRRAGVFFIFLLVGKDSVPESRWKSHKSKENKFLHRSYIPNCFLNSEKNIFWGRKKFPFFCCWNFQNLKNVQWKIMKTHMIFHWKFFRFWKFSKFKNFKNIFFDTSFFFFFGVEKFFGI